MNHVRKMSLAPFNINQDETESEKIQEPQNGGEMPNIIKDRYKLKLINMLKIMSKLASLSCYDENGRIKNRNGGYIERTDIVELILNAMSPGKILIGEERFIELLREANIPPEYILNEAVRVKMSNKIDYKPPEHVLPVVTGNEEPEYEVVYRKEPIKRKFIEEEEEESNKRPKLIGNGIKWIIPKKY